MKRSKGSPLMKRVIEDRLVRRFYWDDGTQTYHGKRVGKDCPLTREEVRAYVERGVLAAVVEIKDRRGCSLVEAARLLRQVAGRKHERRR